MIRVKMVEITETRANVFNFLSSDQVELISDLLGYATTLTQKLESMGFRVFSKEILNQYDSKKINNSVASEIFQILDESNQEPRQKKYRLTKKNRMFEWNKEKQSFEFKRDMTKKDFAKLVDLLGLYEDD